jgi:hypothetical protein
VTADAFVEVCCCGTRVGVTNARPLAPVALRKFCTIQQRVGNAWVNAVEATELLADPASYTTPADGTPIAFGCGTCGAKFVWAAGRPAKVRAA